MVQTLCSLHPPFLLLGTDLIFRSSTGTLCSVAQITSSPRQRRPPPLLKPSLSLGPFAYLGLNNIALPFPNPSHCLHLAFQIPPILLVHWSCMWGTWELLHKVRQSGGSSTGHSVWDPLPRPSSINCPSLTPLKYYPNSYICIHLHDWSRDGALCAPC